MHCGDDFFQRLRHVTSKVRHASAKDCVTITAKNKKQNKKSSCMQFKVSLAHEYTSVSLQAQGRTVLRFLEPRRPDELKHGNSERGRVSVACNNNDQTLATTTSHLVRLQSAAEVHCVSASPSG